MNYIFLMTNIALFTSNVYLYKEFIKDKQEKYKLKKQVNNLEYKVDILESMFEKLLVYAFPN